MKIRKVLGILLILAVALFAIQPYAIIQGVVVTLPGVDIVASASATGVTGVTFSKTTAALKVGGTLLLSATVKPADATDKKVAWSSSKTAVATVVSGKVTAKGAGTAKITVTTNDGNFTASCVVTVTQPVTGVKLSKTSVTVLKGKTVKLTATVLPSTASNKKVTWKSSNALIAAVGSTGIITGKKAGTAYVTVTTVDGKKTAKCKVTVK